MIDRYKARALIQEHGGLLTIHKADREQGQLWLVLESLAAQGILEESHESLTSVSYSLPQTNADGAERDR